MEENLGNETLKELIEENEYRVLENKALICEVAYYIGKNEKADNYIKEKVIDEVSGVDEFVLFYIFCEFVIRSNENATLDEIYEVIDKDYVNMVDMFMKTYTEQD